MREWVRRVVVGGVMGAACAGAGAVWAGALWDAPAGGDPVAPVVEAGTADRMRLAAAATQAATRRAAAKANYEKTSPAFLVRKGTVIPVPAGQKETGRRITLNVDKAASDEAAAAFSKAAGVTLRGANMTVLTTPDIPPVTLHLNDAPLREGLLELCSQAGWKVSSISAQDIVVARNEKGVGIGRWCVCGPVAVVLEGLKNEVRLNEPMSGASVEVGKMNLRLGLEVMAEPGVKVLTYPREVTWEKLEDEKGHSLVPDDLGAGQGGPYVVPVFGGNSMVPGRGVLALTLKAAAGMGQRIPEMRGRAEVVEAVKTEEVVVEADQLSNGVEKEVAGMNVTVEGMGKEGSDYTSTVTYRQGSMSDEEWERLKPGLEGSPAVVMDEAGAAMRVLDGMQVVGTGGNTVTVKQRYYASSGTQVRVARRVVVEVPTAVERLTAPVEFKDVELP